MVNNKNIIVDYLNWKKYLEKKNGKKFIKNFCNNYGWRKGTRLKLYRNFTKTFDPCRKQTSDKHIIDKFCLYGVKDFYVSTVYKSRILKSYFYDLKPNYNVKFLNEDKLLVQLVTRKV